MRMINNSHSAPRYNIKFCWAIFKINITDNNKKFYILNFHNLLLGSMGKERVSSMMYKSLV